MFTKYSTKIIPFSTPYKISNKRSTTAKCKGSFVDDVRNNQLTTYKNFYNNQFYSKYNKQIIVRIVYSINRKYDVLYNELMYGKKVENINLQYDANYFNLIDCVDRLHSLSGLGDELLAFDLMPNKDVYYLVIEYIETMYKVLRIYDDTLTNTYHTQFTKGFMHKLYDIGNNTQLFFTFEDVDYEYLIDIRPVCLYMNHLMDIPNFTFEFDPITKRHKPLIPSNLIHKQAEGIMLDLREMTFHDLGHSYVMSRQDTYLFSILNKNPVELVEEWISNKNWIKVEYEQLAKINVDLYLAVKLYIFDIVHDRGYQFYPPILRQQIRAVKNLENIKTKIIRGNFIDIVKDSSTMLANIDKARDWLIHKVEQLIVTNNLKTIRDCDTDTNTHSFIIRRFIDVENFTGTPKHIVIKKDGDIRVYFDCQGVIHHTSLYEIELLGLNVDKVILSNARITEINGYIDQINDTEDGRIVIDINAETKVFDSDYAYTNKKLVYSEHHLKPIEIYKLERVLQVAKTTGNVRFSITKPPLVYESDTLEFNSNSDRIFLTNGLSFKLFEIYIETKRRHYNTLKYINMDPHKRFVKIKTLRNSYIRHHVDINESLNPYITFNIDNIQYELGIVDTQIDSAIATAVSSVLTRSVDKAKNIYGGHIPSHICERAQLEYVSPHGVRELWGRFGYRFVLSKKVDDVYTEVVGTALIAYSKDNLFFFTSRYNNLKVSTISQDVDFNMTLNANNEHRWFDKFDMPSCHVYKPESLNQLANFAIETIDHRGTGLGKRFIDEIIKHYAIHTNDFTRIHSQPLICGKGLFQIADPSWLKIMTKLGFKHRLGAETFYLDKEWDKLPELIIDDKTITNTEYNKMYGLPQMYESLTETNIPNTDTEYDLTFRIPKVIELSKNPAAKLQYFHLIRMFNDSHE